MSNVITLTNHSLAGSYNNGSYSVVVERSLAGRRYGQNQYRYVAYVTRKLDNKTVKISLATLREATSFYRPGEFSSYKFSDWLERNGSSPHPLLVESKKDSPEKDVVDIDLIINKTVALKINIQKTLTGDSDDVYSQIQDIIDELEEAQSDIRN